MTTFSSVPNSAFLDGKRVGIPISVFRVPDVPIGQFVRFEREMLVRSESRIASIGRVNILICPAFANKNVYPMCGSLEYP